MSEGEHMAESNRTAPLPKDMDYPDPMDATALHLAEFFDCVRTRKPPAEDALSGHHAASCAHLINKSLNEKEVGLLGFQSRKRQSLAAKVPGPKSLRHEQRTRQDCLTDAACGS
jgi:hypothetical protein